MLPLVHFFRTSYNGILFQPLAAPSIIPSDPWFYKNVNWLWLRRWFWDPCLCFWLAGETVLQNVDGCKGALFILRFCPCLILQRCQSGSTAQSLRFTLCPSHMKAATTRRWMKYTFWYFWCKFVCCNLSWKHDGAMIWLEWIVEGQHVPGRTWARDHLRPRPLQNAPETWGTVQGWRAFEVKTHHVAAATPSLT